MIARRTALLMAAASVTVGCGGGFRSDRPLAQTYVLRTVPVRAELIPQGVSLQVARPSSHPGLDSDRIVVLRPDRRLDHLANSRWAAEVPELVEALVVDALRHGGALAAVHDSFGGFAPDYILRITIRRFDADYSSGAGTPRAVVAFDCVLGRRGAPEVLASFGAEGTADAQANRVTAIVAAFEIAVTAALANMAERIYVELRAASPRG